MRALSRFLCHHICKRISNFKTRWLSPFPNTFLCFFEALSSDSYLFVCLLRHRRLQQPRTMFLHSLFTALLVFNSFVTFRFFTHMLPSGFFLPCIQFLCFPLCPTLSNLIQCFVQGYVAGFFKRPFFSVLCRVIFFACGLPFVSSLHIQLCFRVSYSDVFISVISGLSAFSAYSKTTRLMFFHRNSGNAGFLGTLQGFREPSRIIFHRQLPYCRQSVAESDNMGAGNKLAVAFDFVSFVVRHRHFFRYILMKFHGGFVFSPVGERFEVGFPNAMSASAARRATSLLLS